MNRLENKVAIITGGASGIGLATAELFAREGAAVTIADISPAGQQAADAINAAGGRALFVRCNVADAADCQTVVEKTVAHFGKLNVLFNNAGIIRRTTLLTIDEGDWDKVMAVNVKSVYLMSKFAITHMINAGGGSIINTSSGWGLKGGGNAISYCASKGAVTNMTRAMAIDHGAQNIRVNAVAPGDTDTPMLRNEASQLGQAIDSFLSESADRPLRRFAQPIEIAEAVLFLASDVSSYVTGAALLVDGGGLA